VFNKFPRVVRDMAFDLGKEMELSLEGKEVELDKTIIEGISDPLTHLVRNAADHGIEKPDERKKLGKNPKGKILLRAFHEAGQVNIEIIDDGKGLDVNKIKEKALAKNLITEEETNAFSDKEALNLIFLPGFSTAAKVTDVSGRGVGMDVVKTNLDRLGGTVEVSTKKGKGTEVKIRLPLTLAIIPSLIISTAGERYAIPQVNMAELLRIKASEVKDKIEKVGNAEVVRLRGRLLPLVRLKDVLEDEPHFIDPETGRLRMDRRKNIADRRSRRSEVDEEKGQEKEKEEKEFEDQRKGGDRRYHAASAVNIVVVSTGNFQYGLVVDTLHDSEEIVVKPLGRHLKKCEGYAGATIMGDGRVALILDVGNIAKMAQLNSLENTKRAKEVAEEKIKSQDTQSFLIFMNSQDEQFAVPLSLVNRIERIKIDDIEEIGGRRIIQYRGKSLPVFSINEVANVKPLEQRDILEVIIFKIGGNEIGLLTWQIVDAIDIYLKADDTILRQTGIMGSSIIEGRTTLIIDIFDMVENLFPEWFTQRKKNNVSDEESITILLAEDSTFFRGQVKKSLEDEGYSIIEAEDGSIAWDLLKENKDSVSLVVTDIEMPNLDGLGLTQKIKTDEKFSHLPVIALTTLASDEDILRGKDAGVDDYQIKLDKEKLLASISSILQ
ncbi:MAG: chemotaxis protein CheW, partial [Thermodesulfobacteriota bacterium]|nr:chemotaxis protein CheW [Thermodesulfobacteriota bacterium]